MLDPNSRPTCSPRRHSRGRLCCFDLGLALAVLWSEKEKLNKLRSVITREKYEIGKRLAFGFYRLIKLHLSSLENGI